MTETPRSLPDEIARLPITEVELEAIARDPQQPRQSGAEDGIEELAGEIRTSGLINPVVLREPFPDETLPPGKSWVLLMGERRTLALRHLGRSTVPARIVPEGALFDRARLLLQQIGENVYNPLNPLDKAAAYARAFRLSQIEDQKSFAAAYGVDATLLNRALKIEEAFAAELDEEGPEARVRAHLRRACQAGTIRSPEALLILLSLGADHPKRVRRLLRAAHPAEPITRRAARNLQARLAAPAKPPAKPATAGDNGLIQVPVALVAAILAHFGVSEIPDEPGTLVPLLERRLRERSSQAA
jgi:ParB/RepB/Spo0J family partition protein